jgi:hypothetical protein
MKIREIIGFILLRATLLIILSISLTGRAITISGPIVGGFGTGWFIGHYILPFLVIIGVITLFSLTGAIVASIGAIITLLFITPTPTTLSTNPWGAIAFVGLALMVVGIIYGLMEGIIKLVKFIKNKNSK